jgi:hypothetical protein
MRIIQCCICLNLIMSYIITSTIPFKQFQFRFRDLPRHPWTRCIRNSLKSMESIDTVESQYHMLQSRDDSDISNNGLEITSIIDFAKIHSISLDMATIHHINMGITGILLVNTVYTLFSTLSDYNVADCIIYTVTKHIVPNNRNISRIAVHELGHAMMASHFYEWFDIYDISIEQGGHMTCSDNINLNDPRNISFLNKKIMVLLGGYIAESIFYGPEHMSIEVFQDITSAKYLINSIIPVSNTSLYNTSMYDSCDILSEYMLEVNRILWSKRSRINEILPILLKDKSISGYEFYDILWYR